MNVENETRRFNQGPNQSADSDEENRDVNEELCEWVDEGNEEEDHRISLGLIGKLWSERTLNPNAFMTTIKNVWVTQHGIDINMIGKHLYQIQFYHWRETRRKC